MATTFEFMALPVDKPCERATMHKSPIASLLFVAAIVFSTNGETRAQDAGMPAALSRLNLHSAQHLSREEAGAVRGEGVVVLGAQFGIQSLVFPNGGLANLSGSAGGTAIDLTATPQQLAAATSGTFLATEIPGPSPAQGLTPNLTGGQRTGDFVFGQGFLYNTRTGEGFQFSGGSYLQINGTRAQASLFSPGQLTTIDVIGNGVLQGAPNTLQFSR
jgi:hypothetical protein